MPVWLCTVVTTDGSDTTDDALIEEQNVAQTEQTCCDRAFCIDDIFLFFRGYLESVDGYILEAIHTT